MDTWPVSTGQSQSTIPNIENAVTQQDHTILLTRTRVRDIDRSAGSYLHSSRVDPAHVSPHLLPRALRPQDGNERTLDMTPHIKRVFERLGLAALILVGDNAGLVYAARLDREGVPAIGIPKSVHNDVNGSDYCLGFSTSLARGVRLVHDVRAMAGSREEIAVVEMFGRSSGLTTMLISALAGVDRTLIPEVAFDPQRLAGCLADDQRRNSSNYAVLAMSEAVSIEPAVVSQYGHELSRRAGARRPASASVSAAVEEGYTIAGERARGIGAAGGGAVVTEILEELMDQRLLFQPLTYLLRVGEPDGQDLLGANNFAMMAVRLLERGQTGRLVAYRRKENYVDLPLEVVSDPAGAFDVAEHYDPAQYRVNPSIFWASGV